MIYPRFALLFVVLFAAAAAEVKKVPSARVNFDDFKRLVAEAEPHRAKRLIDLDAFLKMSAEPGTIILDSRSAFRYDRIHVKGARHLSFTDFTQENLRKAIPHGSRILIYCNNNFEGDPVDFADKSFTPNFSDSTRNERRLPDGEAGQFAAQARPTMLALNIPTYVTLYGYGYRDVYELSELVNVRDSRIVFEGSIVKKP